MKIPRLWDGLLFAAASLMPATSSAQEAYFRELSIPPNSAGTCVPIPNRPPDKRGSISGHLIIKSIVPGRDRDMTVLVDTLHRTIGYYEFETASTGLGSGVFEAFGASFFQPGRVIGFASHLTVKMSAIDAIHMNHIDSASLRKMRENAKTVSSRRPLDAEEQRRAREVADWLRKRCPS